MKCEMHTECSTESTDGITEPRNATQRNGTNLDMPTKDPIKAEAAAPGNVSAGRERKLSAPTAADACTGVAPCLRSEEEEMAAIT